MAKIGICFPTKDFLRLTETEFNQYLETFQKKGLYSIDLYTEFLLKHKPTNVLLKQIKNNKLKITLHYNHQFPEETKEAIKQIKKQLKELRKILDTNQHRYQTNIVFHVPDYPENKYAHLKEMIYLFQEITEYAKKQRFNILIETLSNNHPAGSHIGNDFSEIILFLNNIPAKNFGVCWDLGHTRLNHLENKESLFVPPKIINRIKFTHIHNAYQQNGEYNEHIPLTDLKLQSAELKFLIQNNYKGIYNLEYGLDRLPENIDVYLDNIQKLNNFIEKNKEEKNGI